MQSKATTVESYLASLPADRRAALQAVRKTILANLDAPIEEGMQYGMIGYYLPHSAYPAGYHCDPKQPLPIAGLASQKNYMSLHLCCVYLDANEQRWFVEQWKQSGKKLDMGKSCVRFKQLEDVPLDVIGRLFKRVKAKEFVALYESVLRSGKEERKQARGKQVAARPAAKSSRGAPAGKAAVASAARRPRSRSGAPKK